MYLSPKIDVERLWLEKSFIVSKSDDICLEITCYIKEGEIDKKIKSDRKYSLGDFIQADKYCRRLNDIVNGFYRFKFV